MDRSNIAMTMTRRARGRIGLILSPRIWLVVASGPRPHFARLMYDTAGRLGSRWCEVMATTPIPARNPAERSHTTSKPLLLVGWDLQPYRDRWAVWGCRLCHTGV